MTRAELPDVNVLLALLNPNHVAHDIAGDWFDSVEQVATTPVTELGLVRLSLNPTVMGQRVAPAAAFASLRGLKRHERVTFVSDSSSLDEPAVELPGLQGHRQVTDFHLVNLAAQNDLTLVTLDRALRDALLPHDRGLVRLLG